MRSLIACVLFSCALAAQATTQRPLPFSDNAWDLQGERTTVVKDGGREVLQVETGTARRRRFVGAQGLTIDAR